MKRWMGAAIILAVGLLATARGQQPAPPAPNAVPGELLVQYNRAASRVRRDGVLATRRARLIRRFDQVDIDHVQLSAGESMDAAIQAFRAMGDVAAVSPNYERHAVQGPPNDPRWLDGTLWGLLKIQMPTVWNTLNARGDGSVVIMDIDTGLNYNHQDLAANTWTNPGELGGVTGVDDDGDGYVDDLHGIDTINHDSNPIDDNGHGSHTAGTIAAVGNNGLGVVGVNWNAKILPCKFLSAAGSGSDAGAIECLNYAVLLKTRAVNPVNIRVTNNSWGGARGSSDPTPLKNAFAAAGAAGIINFVAAGNGDANGNGLNLDIPGNEFDPASLSRVEPSIIAVAASDSADARAGFSNFGPLTVSLAAPGVGIVSTYSPGNATYGSLSGTSMATPHVAGVAALLASMDPTLTVAHLKAIITANVDVLPQWGGVVTTGGRLNAALAAAAVGGGGGNHAPSATLTGPPNNSTYTAPATVPLTATATDPDAGDTIDHVTFYANGSQIGTDSTAPYAFSWTNVPAGNYALTAIATDNHGLAGAASNTVNVTVSPASGGRTNVALAGNGGVASASSVFGPGYAPLGAINGDRTGANWGASGGWNDGTANSWPDWLEVDFSGSQTINEVDVFSVQDNYASPVAPTPTMTFTQYGLQNFEVQYLDGERVAGRDRRRDHG